MALCFGRLILAFKRSPQSPMPTKVIFAFELSFFPPGAAACWLISSQINPLTHPSYGHEKTYRVSLTSGYPTAEEWEILTQGMLLDGDPNP